MGWNTSPLYQNNIENFPHTTNDGDQETGADITDGEEYVSAAKGSDIMDKKNDDSGNRNDYTHGATDDENQDHRGG